MMGTSYTAVYIFEIVAFSAMLAIFKCALGLLFSFLKIPLSRLRIIDKLLLHISDALLVLVFTTGYLLLSYAMRDGVVRIIDVVLIFLFYNLWNYIFGYIFKFVDNILRQIVLKVIIKPLRSLHNLLVLAITCIIRKQ